MNALTNLLPHAYVSFLPLMTRTIIPCLIVDLTMGRISRVSPILGLGAGFLVDAGVFVAAAIGSIRALTTGITGNNQALASAAQRTALSSIGIAGLAAAAHGLKNLALSLSAFRFLDSEQQYFILKHRSIESLAGQEKNCRAVVIDGLSSEWGEMLDDSAWPLVKELYLNCHVRTYRANRYSATPLCDAAEKGKKALRGPVDILAILGHADENAMIINPRFHYRGGEHQTTCLKEHLQPDAQMILAGCNTATGHNSLAEKVSRHLNGTEVVGFSAYFNPFFTTSSWIKKKLSLWSFSPIDSQGNWIFPWTNTARAFNKTPN